MSESPAVEFATGLRDLLADHADREALRTAWDTDDGRIPGLWKRLADMGVTGLVVPEAADGLGLSLADAMPALIAIGRAAVPEPIGTTLAAAEILRRAGGEQADTWLPRLADGSVAFGVGIGPGDIVNAAEWADVLLLDDPASGAIHVVPTADVALTPQASADRGSRLATVEWQPSAASKLDTVDADQALDIVGVCAAAELIGVSYALCDLAVDYAKTREQFGKVIGSFQAVKHQLADVYVAIAFARPVVVRAFETVALQGVTASRDSSHAMCAAIRAAHRAGRTALQVHGGIGYTYEHDLHIWLKRSWTLSTVYGNADWHTRLVARVVLDQHGAA